MTVGDEKSTGIESKNIVGCPVSNRANTECLSEAAGGWWGKGKLPKGLGYWTQ